MKFRMKLIVSLVFALACLVLMPALPGCAVFQALGLAPSPTATTRPISATDRVYHARQLHTEAMKTVRGLIGSNLITNKDTLKMIKDANAEVGKDLDLAELHALDPDRSVFNDIMDRINANLDKLQQEASKKRANAIPTPTETLSWKPSSLSPALQSTSSTDSQSWLRFRNRSLPANL